MKKILVLISVISILTGCFSKEDVLITSVQEKKILIEKIIQENDKNAEIKYNEIMVKLKEQLDKGDEIAYKEYKEWEKEYSIKKDFGKTPEMPVLGKKKYN